MNIWRDINGDRIKPEDFIVCVEIEQGSKNKYELDKETGLIILDRVLYTSTHYPMNYGFIPKTYSGDNDPLDVFVLCSQPIEKMSLVRCYPIGVVRMIDREEVDEKIIAIPFGDPQYNVFKDITEIPKHIVDELHHFLEVYKALEYKSVVVKEVESKDAAIECIAEAIDCYKKTFE